ncbi:hypothetical protein BWI17_08305 [Betaproteobacteria bacterium GR16-43]|nr:hypothetical protein BWI17_08305 [Betaproteobacteria bacterium GR16-43]
MPPSAARAEKISVTGAKVIPDAGVQRYLAVRRYLGVLVDADRVASTLEAATAACAPPDCDILESNLSRDGTASAPRAKMRLRIVPAKAEAFLANIAALGEILEQRTESEDKTEEVIDVDARAKNQLALRDRLRELLKSPKATVKDLIDVESQLARVQAELDSLAGQRQALANETQKVLVTLELRSRPRVDANLLGPIKDSLASIGRTFTASLAGVITFVVAAVPWVVLLAGLVWTWRRWRRARREKSQRNGHHA